MAGMARARGFILQATYRVISTSDGRRATRRASVRPAGAMAAHFWCGTIGSARTSMCARPTHRARAPSERCRRRSPSTSAPSTARRCAASMSRCPRTCPRCATSCTPRDRYLRSRRALRLALPDRARHQGRLRDRGGLESRRRRLWCSTTRICIRPTSRSSRACCPSISRPTRRASACWRSRCSVWESMTC